jgi:hypothetical protein
VQVGVTVLTDNHLPAAPLTEYYSIERQPRSKVEFVARKGLMLEAMTHDKAKNKKPRMHFDNQAKSKCGNKRRLAILVSGQMRRFIFGDAFGDLVRSAYA